MQSTVADALPNSFNVRLHTYSVVTGWCSSITPFSPILHDSTHSAISCFNTSSLTASIKSQVSNYWDECVCVSPCVHVRVFERDWLASNKTNWLDLLAAHWFSTLVQLAFHLSLKIKDTMWSQTKTSSVLHGDAIVVACVRDQENSLECVCKDPCIYIWGRFSDRQLTSNIWSVNALLGLIL